MQKANIQKKVPIYNTHQRMVRMVRATPMIPVTRPAVALPPPLECFLAIAEKMIARTLHGIPKVRDPTQTRPIMPKIMPVKANESYLSFAGSHGGTGGIGGGGGVGPKF